MTENEIKKHVEDFPKLMGRKVELTQRLLKLNGTDPMQEESIYKRLEDIEMAEALIHENESLTTKEWSVLDHRASGETLQEIGEFFSLTKEQIRKILLTVYGKLAKEHKNIAGR